MLLGYLMTIKYALYGNAAKVVNPAKTYIFNQMEKRPFLFQIKLIGSAIAFSLLVFLLFVYINVGFFQFHFLTDFLRREAWLLLVQTITLFYFLHYTISYFNVKFGKAPNSFLRFTLEILVVLGVGLIIAEGFRQVLIHFVSVPVGETAMFTRKLKQVLMVDVSLLSAVYGFMTSMRIFSVLRQKQVEVMHMQRELAQSQFETLKNKMNPHFLFNSLSTLSALVYTDRSLAEAFVEKLSKTYRYILEQKDNATVPLTMELKFLEHYLFLLKQQFGNMLVVEIRHQDDCNHMHLPPHATMIVLEYIIHQETLSESHPLIIQLATEKECISFTWQLPSLEPAIAVRSEQMEHLAAHYRYLGVKPPVQKIQTHQLLIQLPLLPPCIA